MVYDIKTWTEMGWEPDGSFSQIPAYDAPINGTAGVTNRMILGKTEIDFIKSLNVDSVMSWDWAAHGEWGYYYGSMEDGTSIDESVWWNWVGAPSGRPNDRNTMCISAFVNGMAQVVGVPKSASYEQYRNVPWLVQRIWGNFRRGVPENKYNSGPVLYKSILFAPDSGFVTTKSNRGFWIDAAWLHAKIATVEIPWTVPATMTPTVTETPTKTPKRKPTVTPTPSGTPTRVQTATRTPSSTPTRAPTATRTPSVTPTYTVTPTANPDGCNRASFVSDVTIPDQTILHASETFTKTWRIRNVGTCTWTTMYKIIFAGGEKMGGPDFAYMPTSVPPGQTVDLSLKLVAPAAANSFQGNWLLEAPKGKIFGVGSTAGKPFWVRIRVVVPLMDSPGTSPAFALAAPMPALTPVAQLPVTYDFVANACAAQWEGDHGPLPCPGLDGDVGGSILILSQAELENGTIAYLPSLLTSPEFSNDGSLQGIYPDYPVQAGDHLQVSASCENGAAACSVIFKIGYVDSTGKTMDLWTIGEFYDGLYSNVDLDLSDLAGKTVKFVLGVSALGPSMDDRALWVAPHIVHFEASMPIATATAATGTSSPVPTIPTQTPLPIFTPSPTPMPVSPGSEVNQNFSLTIAEIIDQIMPVFQRFLGQ